MPNFFKMHASANCPFCCTKKSPTRWCSSCWWTTPTAILLNSKFNAVTQPPGLSDDRHNFTDIFSLLVDDGPHVTIVQGVVNGYGAELECIFFLESVPQNALKLFNDIVEARDLAYRFLKPGADMSDIDKRVSRLHICHTTAGKWLRHPNSARITWALRC